MTTEPFNGIKRVGCGKCARCRDRRNHNVFVAVSPAEFKALKAGGPVFTDLVERIEKVRNRCFTAELIAIDEMRVEAKK